MYSPLSDGWGYLVRSSGLRAHKVELYAGDPVSPLYSNLRIADFSVTSDRNAAIRRTGNLTIVDANILAAVKSQSSNIEPYGSEYKLFAGVRATADAAPEYVPLGVFQAEDLSWAEGDTAIEVNLYDRSRNLQRVEALTPYPVGGVPVSTTITAIVNAHVPQATVIVDSSLPVFTPPAGSTHDGDFLQIVQDLAALAGAEAYFDVDGNFRLDPVPSVSPSAYPGSEDWRVDVGSGGVLIDADRRLTREDTYNHIVVTGGPRPDIEPGEFLEPYTAVALDSDANSPTYVLGPFGYATLKIERADLIESSDLQRYANEQLNSYKTLSLGLDFECVMNPALHEGDVVLLRFLDGAQELHLVDRITYSTSWASSVSTKAQRVS